MLETIEFRLNHKPVKLTVDGDRRLLWVLRTNLGLTGAKYGCGEGICGACTVERSCCRGKDGIDWTGWVEERGDLGVPGAFG